jgi:hypothetical protein
MHNLSQWNNTIWVDAMLVLPMGVIYEWDTYQVSWRSVGASNIKGITEQFEKLQC